MVVDHKASEKCRSERKKHDEQIRGIGLDRMCGIGGNRIRPEQRRRQAGGGRAAPSMGLKDAYAGKFLIGCAGDIPGGYSEAELANIKANYNVITPENCMKPQPTHPSEDTYNWTTPDALVKWCQENNIKVWGHTLVWHAQTGNWFFQGTNGQPATRELAMERLKKHIMTVVGRYKGRDHRVGRGQ